MIKVLGPAVAVALMGAGTASTAAVTQRRASNSISAPEASAMTAFVAAWSQSNAEALSLLFERDGKLIIPTGVEIGGRDTIRDFYAVVFRSGYRGSVSRANVVRVTRISDSLSLVEGTWNIRGAKRPNGSARPPEAGRFSAVVREGSNGYRLVALSETPLAQ